MLIIGEVHTGLLQNSVAVAPRQSTRVLDLVRGERVRRWERPIAHAVSPPLLTGLDCRLPSRSGARSRGVGTAVSRALLTGGHVLQGSTYLTVARGEATRRLPWSYYLARPGIVEAIGRLDAEDLALGFACEERQSDSLDLGAVSGRVMDSVQQAAGLDRRPPFRMGRTWLRWVAVPDGDGSVHFTLENETVRTLRLSMPGDDPRRAVDLAEDLALHDWLLTALLAIIDRSRIGSDPPVRIVERLRPAIDWLVHLWMPAARLDRSTAELWETLERHPGFTRQWNTSVARIRDQVSVNGVALLDAVAGEAAGLR